MLGASFLILVGVMSVLIVLGACLTARLGRWGVSGRPAFLRTRRALCRTLGHMRLDALDDETCPRCLMPRREDQP